jgi:hypothetical protein
MKFGQQVNAIIMLLHKKFQNNPHHHFGFMIKYLEEFATRNEFTMLVPVRSASICEFAVPISKWIM